MKERLIKIYEILLKSYGYQGWWPIIDDKTLLCKYHQNAPRNEQEQLEVIFGSVLAQNTGWYPNVVRALQQLKIGRLFTKEELEVIKKAEIIQAEISENNKKISKTNILTQNTSWKNAEKALICLNKNKLIDINKILEHSHPSLAECIRCSGYHNQKAERLKIMAKFLKHTPIKKLQQLDIKTLREILLKIKGIGLETADSIILYAFNKPIFVIDTYTKRIISRIGLCEKDVKYDELQELFMKNLSANSNLSRMSNLTTSNFQKDREKDTELFNEYHALLVEHAKRYCSITPKCERCILKSLCRDKPI
ncbi:hypothetical protein J4434_06620 [Candidatus Woesearchaeota archaeon]|nr:hypothetical protein [Candidatus Woesearchaeota archaeon]